MQHDSASLKHTKLKNELSIFLQSFGPGDVYKKGAENKETDRTEQSDRLSNRELQAALDLLDVAFDRIDLSVIDTARVHVQLETQKTFYEAIIRDHQQSMDEVNQNYANLKDENEKLKSFIQNLHAIVK